MLTDVETDQDETYEDLATYVRGSATDQRCQPHDQGQAHHERPGEEEQRD